VAGFPAIWTTSRKRSDLLLIRNGLVFDGLGNAPRVADVAVEKDRIIEIGSDLSSTGATVIDAEGRAVCPGFIDIHSHTDLSLLVNPNAESKIRQGVASEVTGQDGSSIGPWSDGHFEEVSRRYRESYDVEIGFRTLGEFFKHLEGSPASINLASMVGLGTVREFVIGDEEREATPDELESMRLLVASALREGACGASTGLEYIPSAFADAREIIELVRPLSSVGLPYATHMRNEDDRVLAGVEEAFHIGRMSDVPVHLSHLKAIGQRNWWKASIILEMVDAAAPTDLQVTFDRYPYVAYSTTLAGLFPVWSREGGTDSFVARLRDPDMSARIQAQVQAKIDRMGNWNSVQITSTREDSLSWANGARLGDLAQARNVEPFDLTRHLIIADHNRTSMVGFGMSEENTERFLVHDRGMICSDAGARAPYGPLGSGTPHPRAYGSFPRVLGRYCRDRSVMSLGTAIKKMTSMPADLIKLPRRGRLVEGAFADLVVFDPSTVQDQATFEDPHQYPTGIDCVIVNGTVVIDHERHTEARTGRVLRPVS
jgi:N-acyl-D-amino-acid deacylase